MFEEDQKELTPSQKFIMWGMDLIDSNPTVETFNKEPFYDYEQETYYKIGFIQQQPEYGNQIRVIVKDNLIDGFATFNALNGRFVEMQVKVSKYTFEECSKVMEFMISSVKEEIVPGTDTGFDFPKAGFFDSERKLTLKRTGAHIIFVHPILGGHALVFRPGRHSPMF
ncbi:hypothetical protein J7E24_09505 [Hymenobacter sp. ISL-91]|uniref:hypothetical protein n=1 Tax=Hymenobacter sp. ISL-91 TaxID=2819151 RepID=UPI001BEC977E|nr:hypothetical protein [Hymenobacter sp. ISL-91]MBT2558020.1 hypothetical protein [Hymenobacter sp. ISL-91]